MEDGVEKFVQKSSADAGNILSEEDTEKNVEEVENFSELLLSEDKVLLIDNGITFHRSGDDDKAAKCFRRAAELGSTVAMNRIGILCAKVISAEESLYWYKKAARRGDTFAMVNAGDMYYFGDGVEIDKKSCF